MSAGNTMSSYDRRRRKKLLIRRDGQHCRHCGTRSNLTIDHVLPKSQGGTNDIRNLQLLCQDCNSAKGADRWGLA